VSREPPVESRESGAARKLCFLAVAVLAALTLGAGPSAKKPKTTPAADNGCAVCVEKRPVLDSKLFAKDYAPEASLGYRIAYEIPATLDLLHCFCECKESPVFRHKTLLTCFTDNHAAGCGICLREALMAADLKKQGVPDVEIEPLVEASFKTDGHPATAGRGK
jgi:hypothetical protein